MADTSTVTSAEQQDADAAPKLSKRALKKAAQKKRYSEYRTKRRAREKEAKREKQRIKAEKRAAGELDDDDDLDEQESRHKKKIKLEFGGKVVIDLGFDDKMTDKEIASLCSQLAYTYSANRKASYPFSLLYTSLNGRTMTRLETNGYQRWTETEWWTEGYEHLWTLSERPVQGQAPDTTCMDESKAPESTSSLLNARAPTKSPQDTVVYLTADSEEDLSELKPEETYIIGGICDHNRYKNLCLDKAKESGIRTARLPIGQYLASLPTRKVLTVNQVFEIMVKWVETRSWEEALNAIVPKRKFQAGKGNIDISNGSVAEIVQEPEVPTDSSES